MDSTDSTSPTLRTTCTGCGTPFPDGPRDTAPGGHFPTEGYLCEDCYRQTYGVAMQDQDLTSCSTCRRPRERYDVETVTVAEGVNATVCRECLSDLADFVVRIGMV